VICSCFVGAELLFSANLSNHYWHWRPPCSISSALCKEHGKNRSKECQSTESMTKRCF